MLLAPEVKVRTLIRRHHSKTKTKPSQLPFKKIILRRRRRRRKPHVKIKLEGLFSG